MAKHKVPRDIWLLTSSMGLALVCSIAGVLTHWGVIVMVCTVIFIGLSFAVWLRRLVRYELPLLRLSESIRNGREASQTAVPGLDGYSDFAAGILDRRFSCGEILRTCYEIAVRVSGTRDAAKTTGAGILEAVQNALDRCTALKTTLASARETSGGGASSAPASKAGGENPGAMGIPVAGAPSAVGSVLDEVISGVREMGETLREVDHNAKELIASTEETAYSMSRLDSFLQDMANSGKELESSTDTANRVALEGTKVVGEMAKENEAIIATVKEAATAVEDLGRWSQEVGKIVEVIGDIADETNLLALNAAIIAAQSGEHGKAFGVVAEEIRGLAERTSSSTQEISDLVRAVQQNVANVVQGMKKSLQRVERGELLTRNAGMVLEKVFESFESSRSMAKQIAASTFEHKIDSSHVVRSIHRVTDIARRLESHKFAKWTTGETLATATVVKVLSQTGHDVAAPHGPERAPDTGPLSEALARGEDDLDKSMISLERIRDEVSMYLTTIDDVADAVHAAVKNIHPDVDGVGSRKCWQITDCDPALRGRCPAYVQDDWRCFLTEGVACHSARDGSPHADKRCAECRAFKNNMDCLTAQTVGLQK
ncbi:MAG: methyl-accepting chemotaxis protein [Candidatus Eisenbacteria bacterium]